MKSSVQQYIGLFLTLCMILFCVVGIVSDGFTDFEFVKPKAVASAEAADVEQDSSATTAGKVLGGYAEGEKITRENERVEFSFSDGGADVGYSIDENGFFTFSEDKLSSILAFISTLENVEIKFSFGFSELKSLSSNGEWNVNAFDYNLLISTDELTGFNFVRKLCLSFDIPFKTVNAGLTLVVRGQLDDGSFKGSEIFYNKGQISILTLDRYYGQTYSNNVTVDEGYIFDGWYSDPDFNNYCSDGITPRSCYPRKYWYLDELWYSKISPAVKIKYNNYFLGGYSDGINVAVGTVYNSLATENELNSISAIKLKTFMDGSISSIKELSTSCDLVFTNGEIYSSESSVEFVINEDIGITVEPYIELNFYVDNELYYTGTFSRYSGFTATDVPIPQKTGYTFYKWRLVSSLEDVPSGSVGMYDYGDELSPINRVCVATFVSQKFTVTVDKKGNHPDFGSGEASYQLTCNYGEVLELSALPDKGFYTFVGWYYDDGREYGSEPIYNDVTIRAKWYRPVYTIDYLDFFTGKPINSVKYKRGEILNFERDVLVFYNVSEGYRLTFNDVTLGHTTNLVYDIDGTYYADSDLILSFCYASLVYTVKFFVDGECVHTSEYSNFVSFTYPQNCSREGYDIQWLFDDGSSYDSRVFYNKNLYFYAKYILQKRTVTLMKDDVQQWSFVVDYGTSLNEVLDAIDKKNYNVVSFDSSTLKDDCFVGDVVFEVVEMEQTDKIKNVVKNNWRYIAIVAGGVILFVGIVSMLPKPRRKRK